MPETIFALSSGSPPAGIAVIRISGPDASRTLQALAHRLPRPRHVSLATLTDPRDGSELDRTLVLWLPGPRTATGEDCAELHLHGGRAVVRAVEDVLHHLGLRQAQSGEFTRRSFINGRIDLAEAEGLADLLSAETELQRRTAQAMASGVLSFHVEQWRTIVLGLSAMLEAALDFSDEDDVGDDASSLPAGFVGGCRSLGEELAQWLSRPRAEPLKEGFRVVLAGPPNAGKSTLFNALVEADAAITAPEPGTTRDVITRGVAIEGVPFTFIDTAGLRDEGAGSVELIGIARARVEAERADLVLWLGPEGEGPTGAPLWEIAAQADRPLATAKATPRHRLSALTGIGLAELRRDLVDLARSALPLPGEAALNSRQHRCLGQVAGALAEATTQTDALLAAENMRLARLALDALVGRSGTEDMLDALFGRFCIGK
ncbi:tRNA uridine-5-carboxymethylaminomethyl(34) synthesis GTPase MnmE [Novosphingobium sp.]|uniref:tRNA uridine-5-carboxymethylaminomethyl(34) synthesis GTPase MnmE n=1 Tax=Novosphingobium sp. TaxID=1874826 RepID=UPI0038BB3E90